MDRTELAQAFTEHLAGIERLLRAVDAEERRAAEAVLALQQRLYADPAATDRAAWEHLNLLRMHLEAVRTLRTNLRAQLHDLAERPLLD